MNHCFICHQELLPEMSWQSLFYRTDEEVICGTCKSKLEPLNGDTCKMCSRLLETEYKEGNLCFDCLRWENDPHWKELLTYNLSLFTYNEFLKEIIARFKYRGDYLLAQVFKNDIRKKINQEPFDLLVPIPLSEERLYERGFNQAEALITEAGLTAANILSRIHTEKQSKKSRMDRIHLSQVFQILPQERMEIKGKGILLVDDIYTTGSTLRHAAKILHEHGVKKVASLTIAR